jgi:hypothetical protein
MKIHKRHAIKICIFLLSIVSTIFLPTLTKASVDSELLDFKQVLVGSSSTEVLYITNLESENKVMVNLTFKERTCDFSVGSQGIHIEPGQTLSVEVTFAPSHLGDCSDILYFFYSVGEWEQLVVRGKGVDTLTVEEHGVEDLLDFFDEGVDIGTLRGSGPGKSADKRLNALRNMLEAAVYLGINGDTDEACGQLKAVHKKTDSLNTPVGSPDFVEGEAVSDLAAMTLEVMENLGCQ